MQRILSLCLIVSCFTTGMVGKVEAAETSDVEKAYTFGIVPQQAATKLAEQWLPVLERLSQDSGIRIVFKTAPSIPEFEKRLAKGEYDFAYMNPYHYVVFSEQVGYRAIAKQSNKQLSGIIVVAKDSNLDTLNDLEGKTIAFPSPGAFAASILSRGYLSQQGIGFTPEYVGSHDSVYRNVATKRYVAGGGILRTFNSVDPAIRDELKILWTSDGYTPHAFAAHKTVPVEISVALSTALENLHTTDGGAKLLSSLEFVSIEKAADSQWDDVRALGRDPDSVISQITNDLHE